MLGFIGIIGGAWRGLVDLAWRNPALKWALIALGVVLAVEVVAELGLKLASDYQDYRIKAAEADSRNTTGLDLSPSKRREVENRLRELRQQKGQ